MGEDQSREGQKWPSTGSVEPKERESSKITQKAPCREHFIQREQRVPFKTAERFPQTQPTTEWKTIKVPNQGPRNPQES